jgi:hypothetical protein
MRFYNPTILFISILSTTAMSFALYQTFKRLNWQTVVILLIVQYGLIWAINERWNKNGE